MIANIQLPEWVEPIEAEQLIKSFYRDRPVLVIGADGFLGLNCVQALSTLGAEISLLSRRQSPRAAALAKRVHSGDMADPDCIERAVAGQTVVFDFAGITGATQSNLDAYLNLEVECRPHLTAFQACARSQTKPTVIFLSSRLVYGPPQQLPLDETHRLNPQSMYAAHKITLEHYLKVFATTAGLPSVVLRLSNPYGPYIADKPKSYGIINQFILKALRGEPITLYGDGKQQRDYIYVDDVIHTALAVAAEPNCHGEIFNLGGRQGLSLRKAVASIAECLDQDVDIRHVAWPEEARRIETGDYLTDMHKLDCFLNLRAQIPFQQGIAQTLAQLTQTQAKAHA